MCYNSVGIRRCNMDGLIFLLLILGLGGLLYFLYRRYDEDGLGLFLVITTVLAFILSLKIGRISNFDMMLYVPVYMNIFIVFYILIEKGYKKNINKYLYLIGLVAIAMVIMFGFSYCYLTTISNTVAINVKKLFLGNWLNIVVFPILLIVSVIVSIYLYGYTKKFFDHIFINSCFAAIVVQLADSLIIVFLAFGDALSITEVFRVALMTYSFKLMASILLIPVLYYVLKYKKVKE